jgi:hypothetical protein
VRSLVPKVQPRDVADAITRGLARYPDLAEDPLLAALFVASDRQSAGLGALARKTRPRTGPVSNTKEREFEWRCVLYKLDRNYPAHEYFDPDSFFPQQAMLRIARRPPVHLSVCVRAHDRDLESARGRKMVAEYLREARRELRAALAAHGVL